MYEEIKQWLKDRLDEERYAHSLGAEITARELAYQFDADSDKAQLAALLHDNAKSIPADKLFEIIEKNNLAVSEYEKHAMKTLHAPVGAFLAQKELGITDTEIFDAIRYHTTGRINMSLLEKIVFLADKIEPETRDKEFRKKVIHEINMTHNLDKAILLCYKATIKSLLDRKLVIDPLAINVWNSLILKLENKS